MKTNKQNTPIQGVMQSGWYAAQDDDVYFYIDQWCNFGNVLVVHILKEWSGDEDDEVEDNERWYTDYEFDGDKPMLFNTKEECMDADNIAQSFRKAKKEADGKEVKDNLIAALKDFAMYHDHSDTLRFEANQELEKVLKEMGAYKCCLCGEYDKLLIEAYPEAMNILRRQSIICQFIGDGFTQIPLASISHVSKKCEVITIEMHTGQKYSISKKNDNTLYVALSKVFSL